MAPKPKHESPSPEANLTFTPGVKGGDAKPLPYQLVVAILAFLAENNGGSFTLNNKRLSALTGALGNGLTEAAVDHNLRHFKQKAKALVAEVKDKELKPVDSVAPKKKSEDIYFHSSASAANNCHRARQQ